MYSSGRAWRIVSEKTCIMIKAMVVLHNAQNYYHQKLSRKIFHPKKYLSKFKSPEGFLNNLTKNQEYVPHIKCFTMNGGKKMIISCFRTISAIWFCT
jgi:hypothetical protein